MKSASLPPMKGISGPWNEGCGSGDPMELKRHQKGPKVDGRSDVITDQMGFYYPFGGFDSGIERIE